MISSGLGRSACDTETLAHSMRINTTGSRARRASQRSPARSNALPLRAPGHCGQQPQVLPPRENFRKGRCFDDRADSLQSPERLARNIVSSTRTRPEVGRTNPSAIRIVVDFPAPFWPRKPKMSPRSTCIDNRSTTTRRRYFLVNFSVCKTA